MGLLFTKKTTACPYCYQSLDVDKVAFRCAGAGLPGRDACQPITDSRRAAFFNDNEPVMPSIGPIDPATGARVVDPRTNIQIDVIAKSSAKCNQCGGTSRIRICPECHSLLPHELDNSSPLYGLIGVRNSGKTVLLSVLHRELVRNVARRFNASIDNPGGSSGLARDLARFEEDMSREGGSLPPQTPATGGSKKAPAVYEWKRAHKNGTAATIFSFYDTAGEDVSQQERVLQQKYLGQAGGIILLLDPFAFPENLARAVDRGAGLAGADSPESTLDGITYLLQTEHAVKRDRKIKIPLAVVVSKIDAFFDQVPPNHPLRDRGGVGQAYDDAEGQTIHDHVAALIASWGGDNLLRKLEMNYQTYRLFGLSALGAEPDYRSGSVNTRGLLPHRVADPLLWLLADGGFLPKVKG